MAEEEGQGLLCEVPPLPDISYSFNYSLCFKVLYLRLNFVIDPICFFFQDLDLLKRASSLREEAQ